VTDSFTVLNISPRSPLGQILKVTPNQQWRVRDPDSSIGFASCVVDWDIALISDHSEIHEVNLCHRPTSLGDKAVDLHMQDARKCLMSLNQLAASL